MYFRRTKRRGYGTISIRETGEPGKGARFEITMPKRGVASIKNGFMTLQGGVTRTRFMNLANPAENSVITSLVAALTFRQI